MAVDATSNFYIAERLNYRIRKVSTTGTITTVAGGGSSGLGDGGLATSAQLKQPLGVAVDPSGNIFIADGGNNRIRKVSAAGIITTVAGGGSSGLGDGGPATDARIAVPSGVTFDAAGNLYIAEFYSCRIRKVSATGIITTVAGSGTYSYSGDGGPAANAQLSYPWGVAVDASGNLYVTDNFKNSFGNNRIRKVSATGTIATVAGNGSQGYSGDWGPAADAELGGPTAVAVDANGNLYIADYFDSTVRRVSASGIITTIAGNGSPGYSGDAGPASGAQLYRPNGVAVDAGGNLYIADTSNSRIRKVSAEIIATIAGNGSLGYSGDGGPAASAQLFQPYGVAVDASGNVYVADTGNNAVRLLTPSGSECAYSASSTSLQSPVVGESFTLTITTTAGCVWASSNLPDWITVAGPASGSGPATVNVVVAPNPGPPRSAQISVAGIAVTVNQASSVLLVNTNGVVNAASYTAPLAAGSIASIFGNFLLEAPVSISSFPVPTSLEGLSFQLSGVPLAPLFYASLGQANA